MARLRALIAFVACVCFAQAALAQTLQRLTVTQLTLSANQGRPQVEVPFDLIVTARVRERVSELRNLDLPVLSDVELLGDSQTIVSDAHGTTYTERIRVVAHHSGTITIDPVTLDAVDARDGRAKRYSSNSLTLTIGGGIAAVAPHVDVLGILFTLLRWAIGVAALILIVRLFVRRRPAPRAQPVAQPLPPPVPVDRTAPTREDLLRDARVTLAAHRDRATVLQIRTIARGMVGATDAETLGDVLERTQAGDRVMRDLLIALERAAFTYDDDIPTAVERVLLALDAATR
ncbi:MAG TPA: hypothetical protein VFN49_13840 [Candidatus Aquilonibacter sp.]|nr:hypothetical protein [Candidatus Aquilonibacter sp.]